MKNDGKATWWVYWAVTAALLAGGVVMLFAYTPVEATMGPIQKIFYAHMPAAVISLLACMVVFVAGIAYLWRKDLWWDHLAASAARTVVVLAGFALVSGMVWAKKAWGAWWVATPRLTFTLVLWLLYVVYLVLRSSIESSDRRAIVAAVYGIVAFLDVPLVWFSARLIKDPLHPPKIGLEDHRMVVTLLYWFLPVLLIALGLTIGGLKRAQRQAGQAERSAPPDVV
ncbi:MAG: cytochrome c biogenesis protein CcsA [Phycisphaerae bacterium]|nr:cytochrome c biogenesis protein CcsA [Phycisphaerae bacterium]